MEFLLVLIPMQEDMSANSLFTYIIIIILFLFILLIVILSFLWLPPQHHGMWSTLHTITVVYFLMWFLDGSSCVCIYIYIFHGFCIDVYEVMPVIHTPSHHGSDWDVVLNNSNKSSFWIWKFSGCLQVSFTYWWSLALALNILYWKMRPDCPTLSSSSSWSSSVEECSKKWLSQTCV
jgi:hypothetical protein